jgi:hypothetical protein
MLANTSLQNLCSNYVLLLRQEIRVLKKVANAVKKHKSFWFLFTNIFPLALSRHKRAKKWEKIVQENFLNPLQQK